MLFIFILFLLILYQFKHFICDYPLQGKYMLGKFLAFPDYILPLLAHVLVHGLATLLITEWATHIVVFPLGRPPGLDLFCLKLALFDMGVHFVMDRIKASPKLLGRFKYVTASEYRTFAEGASYEGTNPELLIFKRLSKERLRSNVFFWWALGFDQMVHHLTHYAIIATLVWRIA